MILSFLKQNSQFIRFLFIGGINTLFGYSVYVTGLILGLHFSLAALFANILGVLFNFKTTGRFVFKSRNNALIFRFIGVYIFLYLLNVSLLNLFHLFSFDLKIAGAMTLLPLAILSFLLNKAFVFKRTVPPAVGLE